jgi:hypothetical protein
MTPSLAVKVPSAPSDRAIGLAQPVEKSQLQQLTLHDWIKSAQERPEILATDPPPAATSDPDPETTPPPMRGITYNQLRASLLSAQLAIVNYCIRHSYSLKRWRNVVNVVMILKEPGNFKIHRLPVLHLYEADYSVIQGNKSRELLIHHAVDHNLLHTEQHGGVPGRDSLTVPFIEQMLREITRASRRPIIRTDFDATSCFDRRIIPSIASLACRGFGQHRRICSLQAHALQGTNYQLKTPLGITEQGYSHCAQNPIYGTGLGSSSSPSIWTCISSILLKAHDACGHSAVFRSPNGHFTAETNLQAVVNDTYLTTNGDAEESCEAIVAKAQAAAQDWCDLLRATGGDLEPTKSSSYLVMFGFTMTGAPVMKRFPQECQIRVQDEDGVLGDPFKSVSPFQARPRTLGCYKSPSGEQCTTLKVLREKATALTQLVNRAFLKPVGANRHLRGVAYPSLMYSAPVNFLSEKQLDKVTKILAKSYIPKLAGGVVYGSLSLGGLGLQSLWVAQGIDQICMFIKSWRANNIAGQFLRVALAWAQHNSGVGTPILENPTIPIVLYLETQWISSLRTALTSLACKIQVDYSSVYPLQRQHDAHLMDVFREQGNFNPKQLKSLNQCRLFLQVTVVSDICDASGRAISKDYFTGVLSAIRSRDIVAVQERPVAPKTWKQFMEAGPHHACSQP